MSDTVEIPSNPQIRSPHNPRVMMAKNPMPVAPLPLGWDEITKILPHRYPMLTGAWASKMSLPRRSFSRAISPVIL
jgi:hypothetical protein